MSSLEDLNDDFRDLLAALCQEDAEFLVVGAYALAFHGFPRATGDIDILVRPSIENAARVWRALAQFGAPLQASGIRIEDFATPGIVYQIGLPPRRIDILTEIRGVDFDEAWTSRLASPFGDAMVHFLSRDTLAKSKRASGRTKDLADAEQLDAGDEAGPAPRGRDD